MHARGAAALARGGVGRGATGCAARGVDVRAVTVWALLGHVRLELAAHPGRGILRARRVRRARAGAAADGTRVAWRARWQRARASGIPCWTCPAGGGAGPAALSAFRPPGRGAKGRECGADGRKRAAAAGHRGRGGHAGAGVRAACAARGESCTGRWAREEMDIADAASVRAMLDVLRPWAVVNAAGYVRVDDAEREPDACFRANADGAAVLAEACAARGIPLLTVLVGPGVRRRADAPYVGERPRRRRSTCTGAARRMRSGACWMPHPAALVVRTGRVLRTVGRAQLRHAGAAGPARGETLRGGGRRDGVADVRAGPGARVAGPADRRRSAASGTWPTGAP